jgi:hypothetical protein
MMLYTYTPKQLIAGAALTNGLVTYYTAETTYGTILKELILVNTHSAALAVTVHIIPTGGTAGVPTTILSGETLQPGEQRAYSLSTVIPTGSFIQASAGTGAFVVINASGAEVS